MQKEKIRLSLQSFNYPALNQACEKIMTTIFDFQPESKVKGPIALPTRRRIYCVLRSPHVNKDSREQFEIRRYKRIIDIHSVSEQVINQLTNLDLSPAVSTEIEILTKPS